MWRPPNCAPRSGKRLITVSNRASVVFNTTATLIADHPGARRLRRFNTRIDRGLRMEKGPDLALDIEAA